MQRVIQCKLAKKVATKSPKERKSGTPQPAEIESAERLWIKEDQSLTDFKDHYTDLTLFLQGGIVRDGGRLRRSSLVYHQVQPILSLSSNHISALINESSSLRVFHIGWENTLTKSRRRYWIVRGRGLAKKLVRDCTTCRKLRQRPHTKLMAESGTWKNKTILSTILSNRCGSFWPFNLKYERKTLHRPLFTYAMGRAIRLEIVENRSAETFLQDLRSEFAHKQQVSWIFLKQLQTTFYLVALHVVYLKSHLKSRETPESGLHSSRVLPTSFGDALLGSMSPPSCAVRNGIHEGTSGQSRGYRAHC